MVEKYDYDQNIHGVEDEAGVTDDICPVCCDVLDKTDLTGSFSLACSDGINPHIMCIRCLVMQISECVMSRCMRPVCPICPVEGVKSRASNISETEITEVLERFEKAQKSDAGSFLNKYLAMYCCFDDLFFSWWKK